MSMSDKESIEKFYMKQFVEQIEKNDISSNNNNSRNFLNEIVNELCNLYEKERLN
ncbi:4158_t:CDS:1, partial [Scutellospora calospora]